MAHLLNRRLSRRGSGTHGPCQTSLSHPNQRDGGFGPCGSGDNLSWPNDNGGEYAARPLEGIRDSLSLRPDAASAGGRSDPRVSWPVPELPRDFVHPGGGPRSRSLVAFPLSAL